MLLWIKLKNNDWSRKSIREIVFHCIKSDEKEGNFLIDFYKGRLLFESRAVATCWALEKMQIFIFSDMLITYAQSIGVFHTLRIFVAFCSSPDFLLLWSTAFSDRNLSRWSHLESLRLSQGVFDLDWATECGAVNNWTVGSFNAAVGSTNASR